MNICKNRRERLDKAYWADDARDGNPPPNANVVLSLTNVSSMFGISRIRLVAFELLGLTKRRYRNGSQRVYGWADCERIALLIKTQRAGLWLSEIMPVLRASSASIDAASRRRGLARCMRLIDKLETQRRQTDNAVSELQYVCTLLAADASEHERVVNRQR